MVEREGEDIRVIRRHGDTVVEALGGTVLSGGDEGLCVSCRIKI